VPLGGAGIAALLLQACASSAPPPPRDAFPLDPREGLAGPFEDSIGEGWSALLAGDTARASREFGLAHAGDSARAGRIGAVEVLVRTGRSADALPGCAKDAADPAATLPLLVACGEAEARAGSPVAAYELYARAASEGGPSRPGLSARAQKLRPGATDAVFADAEKAAAAGRFDEARAAATRAVAWEPRTGSVLVRAAAIECAAGQKERALQFDREALSLGDLFPEQRAEAGNLALEVGDDALAVSVFDALAAEDPRYAEPAAEARLAFRISNWPEAERRAAQARRVTRSQAADLVWWMFPEVREARATGVVATDVLDRRDTSALAKAVSLGLLDVDKDTHRARPDAALSRTAAAQMMLRLAGWLAAPKAPLPCLRDAPGPWRGGADALRLASRCGLLSESGGAVVSGPELTRGFDRLRSSLPGGEGKQP
jgi:tetratricopeptide (TPR) repeat protein